MKFPTLIFASLCYIQISKADEGCYLLNEKFRNSRDECLNDLTLTLEELKPGWRQQHLPEKNACLVKCVLEKEEVLDGGGNMQKAQISDKFHIPTMTKEENAKMFECIKEVDKIEECEDVKPITDCIPDSN